MASVYFRNFRKKKLSTPLDEIFLPMWIALPLVLIYIISCTMVIHWFDHNEGNKPGELLKRRLSVRDATDLVRPRFF